MFATLKILVISQHWHPEVGVPQKRWAWLSGILSEAGHEVQVITPGKRSGRDGLRNVDSQYNPEIGIAGEMIFRSKYFREGKSLTGRALSQGLNALGILYKCFQIRRKNRYFAPDLVVGSIPAIPILFVTPLVALFLKRPYVIDLRDAWPELLRETSRWNSDTGDVSVREKLFNTRVAAAVGYVLSKIMFLCLWQASGIIVTSKFLEEDLRNKFQGKTKSVSFITVRNVFPSAVMDKGQVKISQPQKELNVLYAGTIGRAQKLSNAVYAVRLAKKMGVKVNLHLVGEGATKSHLLRLTKGLDESIEIFDRVSSEELATFYRWADSALVHLTDWKGLRRAVPSKTYELMEIGIHITGVVEGESADIISCLGAGSVVKPESPRALAELWVELANDRSKLQVVPLGRDWVKLQREHVAPRDLMKFFDELDLMNEI